MADPVTLAAVVVAVVFAAWLLLCVSVTLVLGLERVIGREIL